MNGSRLPCSEGGSTPECERKCESNYKLSYEQDHHYGKSAYIIATDEQQIQAEIMKSGPVEAAFTVFADFPSYKSGKKNLDLS